MCVPVTRENGREREREPAYDASRATLCRVGGRRGPGKPLALQNHGNDSTAGPNTVPVACGDDIPVILNSFQALNSLEWFSGRTIRRKLQVHPPIKQIRFVCVLTVVPGSAGMLIHSYEKQEGRTSGFGRTRPPAPLQKNGRG